MMGSRRLQRLITYHIFIRLLLSVSSFAFSRRLEGTFQTAALSYPLSKCKSRHQLINNTFN